MRDNRTFSFLICDMKDLIDKIVENRNKREELKRECWSMESAFRTKIYANPNWREFFLIKVAEGGNRTKYEITHAELREMLCNGGKMEFDFTYDGKSVNMKYSTPTSMMGMYTETAESGFFPTEDLLRIDEIVKTQAIPEDVEARIKRKEDRLNGYRERLRETEERIKREEDEIKKLKAWLGEE